MEVLPSLTSLGVLKQGFQPGEFPQREISGYPGVNWHNRLADSNCWNIDLLADLAKVIPIIV